MTGPAHDRDPGDERGRMPRNRFRTLVLLAVLVILVVVFGYMLLVSQVGNG